MDIQISQAQVELFNSWMKHYGNPELDATHTGISVGIKFALEKMSMYNTVHYEKKETTVSVSEETLAELRKKIDDNKIEAMFNIGLASGIAWVLEEFGLYEIRQK